MISGRPYCLQSSTRPRPTSVYLDSLRPPRLYAYDDEYNDDDDNDDDDDDDDDDYSL